MDNNLLYDAPPQAFLGIGAGSVCHNGIETIPKFV